MKAEQTEGWRPALGSLASRLVLAVLAVLLGWLAPLHAVGPSPVATDDLQAIQLPAVAPRPVVQVFLIAYRGQGPPVVLVGLIGGGPSFAAGVDALYSPQAVTNEAGQVVERYSYTAYGERTVLGGYSSSTSRIGFNHGFTGLRDEGGLLFARNRYFSPELGRWTSRDPAGYVDGYGLYAGYFIPNGMDPEGKFSIASAMLMGGISAGIEIVHQAITGKWDMTNIGIAFAAGAILGPVGTWAWRAHLAGKVAVAAVVAGATGWQAYNTWETADEYGWFSRETFGELFMLGVGAYGTAATSKGAWAAIVARGAETRSAQIAALNAMNANAAQGRPTSDYIRPPPVERCRTRLINDLISNNPLAYRLAAIRQQLGIKWPKKNLAIAKYEIEGVSGELVGASGADDIAGTVKAPSVYMFTTWKTGANARTLDSEVKILMEFASRLLPNARGVILLHTERPPCVSCSSVIKQFRLLFPGIRVEVSSGVPPQ